MQASKLRGYLFVLGMLLAMPFIGGLGYLIYKALQNAETLLPVAIASIGFSGMALIAGALVNVGMIRHFVMVVWLIPATLLNITVFSTISGAQWSMMGPFVGAFLLNVIALILFAASATSGNTKASPGSS